MPPIIPSHITAVWEEKTNGRYRMYKCELCKQIAPAHTSAHRLVIATRPKTYPSRPEVNRVKSGDKVEWKDDPGGQGVEIVKEILVCPVCAARQEED